MTEKLLTGTLSLNTTNQPSLSRYYSYMFQITITGKEEPDRATPVRPTTISPHVQELLDNLNEGRSSLRGLQSPPRHVEGGNKDLPRAGVYSSPMPLLTGKVSKVR